MPRSFLRVFLDQSWESFVVYATNATEEVEMIQILLYEHADSTITTTIIKESVTNMPKKIKWTLLHEVRKKR